MSPAFAGGFFTTKLPGKPMAKFFCTELPDWLKFKGLTVSSVDKERSN